MNETLLDYLVYAALFVLLFLWGLLGFSYIYRKQRLKKQVTIEKVFATTMAQYLYPDPSKNLDFIQVQRIFRKAGVSEKHPKNVQFLIRLMVRTQQAFAGEEHEKIKDLYDKIPPYKHSYRKTLQQDPYAIARGIREIYEMDQRNYVRYLTGFRNHPNIYVRRESQIALVIFLGWKSLRFLPYLEREMELWQQIKMVEKLHELHPEPQLKYLREVMHVESESGTEILMMIIRRFRIYEELDYIIAHIAHPVYYVSETAVRCLLSFQLSENQMEKVKEFFPGIKNLRLQKRVMDHLVHNNQDDDMSFYMEVLQNSADWLRLKAAEILWNKGYKEEVLVYFPERYEAVEVDLKDEETVA